jgi:3-mercaptopyruvate sulfurtransferase SseA
MVVIADNNKNEQTMIRLLRIGYDNVLGYLEGGVETYTKNGGKTTTVRVVNPKDFCDVNGKPEKHLFLDVRKPHEWATGIYPNAMCI